MHEEIHNFHWIDNPRIPFQVVLAGISYCDGTYRITRHSSTVTVMEYVTQGQGTIKINQLTYHPQAGDVYILPQKAFHDYYADHDNPWIKLWFNIRGNLVPQLLACYGLGNMHVIRCPVKHLFDYGLALVREKKNAPSVLQQELALVTHRIIMELASAVSHMEKEISETALVLKNYLDSHLEQKITLSELGRLVSRTGVQVIRIFKNAFHATPYDYLLRKKIECAKLLLVDTRLPVKDISYRLGFTDEYYFSNVFKSKAGMAPLYFRKRVG